MDMRYVKSQWCYMICRAGFMADVVLYGDYEYRYSQETGSELVNKLISNIEWGMKRNFLDVPTRLSTAR